MFLTKSQLEILSKTPEKAMFAMSSEIKRTITQRSLLPKANGARMNESGDSNYTHDGIKQRWVCDDYSYTDNWGLTGLFIRLRHQRKPSWIWSWSPSDCPYMSMSVQVSYYQGPYIGNGSFYAENWENRELTYLVSVAPPGVSLWLANYNGSVNAVGRDGVNRYFNIFK